MAQSLIPLSQVVRARRVELVDEEGNVKITLGTQKIGPVIRLWGRDNRVKASLGLLTTDQPALSFLDGYLPRVDPRLEEDGQPTLGLVQDRHMDACGILIENAKRLKQQAKRKAKKGKQ